MMEHPKLTKEDYELFSKKVAELNKLHNIVTEEKLIAYQYEWVQLNRAITTAILEYKHIIHQKEITDKNK